MNDQPEKLLLADLGTVRVLCRRCRTEFVYPIANLAEAFRTREGGREFWCCPHCHALVQGETGAAPGGPFRPLLQALTALKGLEDRVAVWFVVRKEDPDRRLPEG
jgi:hypothetical protein